MWGFYLWDGRWGIFVVIQLLSIITMIYQMRVIRELRKGQGEILVDQLHDARIAKALVSRSTGIKCDDCGNVMNHGAMVEVIERSDGTVYVGHQSHNRTADWLPPPKLP